MSPKPAIVIATTIGATPSPTRSWQIARSRVPFHSREDIYARHKSHRRRRQLVGRFAAAVAIYAIGFLIYGALFSKMWMGLTGYTHEQLQPHRWKMALSPLMPILTAVGLALVLKWARVDSVALGVMVAAEVWFFLVLSTRLYSYTYSPEKPGLLLMDAIHLLLGFVVAGAIIGGWRRVTLRPEAADARRYRGRKTTGRRIAKFPASRHCPPALPVSVRIGGFHRRSRRFA